MLQEKDWHKTPSCDPMSARTYVQVPQSLVVIVVVVVVLVVVVAVVAAVAVVIIIVVAVVVYEYVMV